MNWITASDSVDHALAAAGVPDESRMRIMAHVITAMSREARRLEREARTEEVKRTVGECRGKVPAAAERLGICPRAVYHHLEKIETT